MVQKLLEGKLYKQNSGQLEQFASYIDIAKGTGYVPNGFEIESIQDAITQNGDPVVRLRFTRQGKESSLYTEHFSMTIRKADKLILGFVDLSAENVVSLKDVSKLPTEDEMPVLVSNFFKNWDPQYLETLEDYAYRSPYGENIKVDGTERSVAGTEWKWYAPDTADWGWVVFGKNYQPIIFERNIRWVTGRTTEKWLHDKYLETGSLDFVPVTVK